MADQIVLSPTRIKRWVRCRKSYYWRYHQHLVRIYKEVPPSLGLVVGEALARYYSYPLGDRNSHLLISNLENVLKTQAPEFLQQAPNKERQAKWESVINLSRKLLNSYHDWATNKDLFEVLSVEHSYQVELAPNVYLMAIPDTVVSDHAFNMVLEHKVRYRYRPGDFGIDYQSVGACLVSDSIGTYYNILEYSHLKFYREPIIRSQEELNYFKNMFIELGRDILNTPSERMYPMPFKRCSCEYWELCNAEIAGLDMEDIIRELYRSTVKDKKEHKEHKEELESE